MLYVLRSFVLLSFGNSCEQEVEVGGTSLASVPPSVQSLVELAPKVPVFSAQHTLQNCGVHQFHKTVSEFEGRVPLVL